MCCASENPLKFKNNISSRQNMADAGQDKCSKGRMQDRSDAGEDRCRKGRMQVRSEAGQNMYSKDGCRTGLHSTTVCDTE